MEDKKEKLPSSNFNCDTGIYEKRTQTIENTGFF